MLLTCPLPYCLYMEEEAFDLGHFDSRTPITNLLSVLLERRQVVSLLFQYAGSDSPQSPIQQRNINSETQLACTVGARSHSSTRMLLRSVALWYNLEFCSLPLIHINLNGSVTEVTIRGLGLMCARDIILFFNIHSFIRHLLNSFNGQGIIKKKRCNKTNKTWFHRDLNSLLGEQECKWINYSRA